jgi:hypothetical protein
MEHQYFFRRDDDTYAMGVYKRWRNVCEANGLIFTLAQIQANYPPVAWSYTYYDNGLMVVKLPENRNQLTLF